MLRKLTVLFCLILICVTCVNAATLIPGGQVIGLNLSDGTLTVVRVENETSPLKPGDRLLSLDGADLRTVTDVKAQLKDCPQTLCVSRDGKKLHLQTAGGKLGVYLRQGTSGLGTVTYYDPENNTFGALGHGVCDNRGNVKQMDAGTVYSANVFSVKEGKVGAPGQLLGAVTDSEAIGTLSKNTNRGIFGEIAPIAAEPLPIGKKAEIQTGSATIYSTVSGATPREYSVEILKIYPQGNDTRNLLLKITDPDLLTATGGIVQGMSGSPLVQDGKLIGAVTHVLVNDPTMGYGIFIENMLEAAG